MGRSIPKLIVQTCPARSFSDALQRSIDDLLAANPGWEHRLFDDEAIERFIGAEFGDRLLGYYRRIEPSYGAARADFFRYLAMYRLGGVYLDIKSRFTRPIDEVLNEDDRFIVSRWRNKPGEVHEGFGLHGDIPHLPRGELQQWHIITVAGHPFLRAVIERMLDRIDKYRPWHEGVGWLGVLRLTGPLLYTQSITPLLGAFPCREVDSDADLALEYSAFPPSAHQRLFAKHYSRNHLPLVRLGGVLQWLSVGFCEARLPAARSSISSARRNARAHRDALLQRLRQSGRQR